MISEVVNSLFVTYFASEFLVAETSCSDRRRHESWFDSTSRFIKQRISSLSFGVCAVLLVNLLDHVSGIKEKANLLLQGFFHLPKIIFAAVAYTTCLYYDIHRRSPLLTLRVFLAKVGWAFLRVLPAYPFLAVLISFVFLFVINIWEARFAIGMAKRPNLLWNFVRSVCMGLYTGQESSCWGIFLLACLKRIQAACKNLQLKYPLLGPFRLLSLLSIGGETSSFVVRMRKYNRIPRCKVME